MIERLKRWAKAIRRDVHALWLAARDPRTPRLARVLALLIAAYAVSPIDLIPDFIPVLGLLDEAILLPLAIATVIRLIPPALMAEHRTAAAAAGARPSSTAAAVAIATLWLVLAGLAAQWAYRSLA